MTTIAYSYIRFSSIAQSEGYSLERQSMSAQEYADKEGLALDTTLKLRDLGVSAFRGKNTERGALNEFMLKVESGEVAAGSYLLIEDMDRLTRLPVMKALTIFQRIMDRGIVLVTLKNGMKYSRESLNDDWTQLMPVLFDMSRGNAESERKSYLLSKSWKKKKADAAATGKPIGRGVPMWLKLEWDDEQGKEVYKAIPERVEVINRIFQLSIDGYGTTVITAMLNKEGVPAFRGTDWGTTSVSRLLGNRSVLGEYQPHLGIQNAGTRVKDGSAIPGYFPEVVTPDLFNRAQEAMASRYIHRATKQSQAFNIWQGVGRCGRCGSNMTLLKKGESRARLPDGELGPPVELVYFTCLGTKKGTCDESGGVRVEPSEKVFLHILANTGNMSLVAADVAKQETQLQALRGKLLADQERLAILTDALEMSPSGAGAVLLTKQEALVDEIRDEITKLEAVLAANTIIDRQSFFERVDLVSREGRNQANALLKRLGIKVTMMKAGRRSKTVYYAVYKDERLIMKLTDKAGTIEEHSYSSDVTMRLYQQGELEEHQLEVNVAFGSKKLPKPDKTVTGQDVS
jgi:hypothetical protein